LIATILRVLIGRRERTPSADGSEPPKAFSRFYELATQARWEVDDLLWDALPLVPTDGDIPRSRRADFWRSILTQQLQADELALDLSNQLLSASPHRSARLFYATMIQDESRQIEAWVKLLLEVGGAGERDPYLDRLAHRALEADTLEEKVFLVQILYERLIGAELRLIGRSSRGTVLGVLSSRFAVDECIHSSAGAAYECFLLEGASRRTKTNLEKAGREALPLLVDHIFWRPRSRSWAEDPMLSGKSEWLRAEVRDVLALSASLGLDLGEIQGLSSPHEASV
jgi:hypothetical protein